MGNVYIVQDSPGKNMLGARDFGEPVVMLPAEHQITFDARETEQRLRAFLEGFTDDDFLLCVGDPAAIAIAAVLAATANDGRVKLLKWDRQEALYFPVQIEVAV